MPYTNIDIVLVSADENLTAYQTSDDTKVNLFVNEVAPGSDLNLKLRTVTTEAEADIIINALTPPGPGFPFTFPFTLS